MSPPVSPHAPHGPTPAGEVEIPTSPQRVVTVNVFGLDAAISVGVVPVGTVSAFGGLEKAVPSELVGTPGAPNLEEQQYTTLAKIAPTIVEPSNYVGFGMLWQEITRTIGRALGRAERAEALVSEVDGRFARARDQHPQFKGRSGLDTRGMPELTSTPRATVA